MSKMVIVENKIKVQSSEFQGFQIELSKTLSIGKDDRDGIRFEKLRCTHSIRSVRYLTHGFHTMVLYSTISCRYVIYIYTSLFRKNCSKYKQKHRKENKELQKNYTV